MLSVDNNNGKKIIIRMLLYIYSTYLRFIPTYMSYTPMHII